MVLFTRNVKNIKGAAHKNGDIDGTCKWGPGFLVVTITIKPTLDIAMFRVATF